MISILMLILWILILAVGAPIAVSMITVSVVTLFVIGEIPLVFAPQYIVQGMVKFELLAVPFFILAAEIMNGGGITDRIFGFALVLVGWIRGGLAQVNVVASVIFAGISGTAVADAAGLGRVEYDIMTKNGYAPGFTTAVTLASCIIGPLVPPSVIGIIYAVAAEVSVGRMLLAGLVPGLLLALTLMVYIYWLVRTGREICPPVLPPPRREMVGNLLGGVPAILAPVFLLWGIVGGVFTPTEAGVAACVYAFFVSTVVYRALTFKRFVQVMIRATLSSAMVMFVIGAATVMSMIITWDQSMARLVEWFSGLTDKVWIQLLVINIFLLFVGCLIEGVPALLITVPVLLPIITRIGVDPVHFGVIIIFNLLVGIITPPMGMGLFIMSNITGLSVEVVTKASSRFLLPLLIALVLITYWPPISLYVPMKLLP